MCVNTTMVEHLEFIPVDAHDFWLWVNISGLVRSRPDSDQSGEGSMHVASRYDRNRGHVLRRDSPVHSPFFTHSCGYGTWDGATALLRNGC